MGRRKFIFFDFIFQKSRFFLSLCQHFTRKMIIMRLKIDEILNKIRKKSHKFLYWRTFSPYRKVQYIAKIHEWITIFPKIDKCLPIFTFIQKYIGRYFPIFKKNLPFCNGFDDFSGEMYLIYRNLKESNYLIYFYRNGQVLKLPKSHINQNIHVWTVNIQKNMVCSLFCMNT